MEKHSIFMDWMTLFVKMFTSLKTINIIPIKTKMAFIVEIIEKITVLKFICNLLEP